MGHVSASACRTANAAAGFSPMASGPTDLWRTLKKGLFDPYQPERHYMRGPGPRWRRKHAGDDLVDERTGMATSSRGGDSSRVASGVPIAFQAAGRSILAPILACLATIAVFALGAAAGVGMSHAAAVSLPAAAVPAIADRAPGRSADGLLATVDLCPWDMRARGQQSSTLRMSTPPPPSSEQGIECPIDAQQTSHLKIFDRGNLPHIRNS
jgi:hypothetical protein